MLYIAFSPELLACLRWAHCVLHSQWVRMLLEGNAFQGWAEVSAAHAGSTRLDQPHYSHNRRLRSENKQSTL